MWLPLECNDYAPWISVRYTGCVLFQGTVAFSLKEHMSICLVERKKGLTLADSWLNANHGWTGSGLKPGARNSMQASCESCRSPAVKPILLLPRTYLGKQLESGVRARN